MTDRQSINIDVIRTAPLLDVAQLNPRSFSTPIADDETVSFIPMKAVETESGLIDSSDVRQWSTVKKGYTAFQEGDVIVAKITPCMENGKFAVAKGLHNGRGAGSTEFHVFRPSERLLPEYLLHFLFTRDVRENAKRSMRGAAGQLRVPPDFYASLRLPVPPICEQRSIVTEIEKQLSRLDAGVAALKRVQANLKRYRAAVLKAACEGKLVPTEAALARQDGREYESGAQLLEQIQAERRAKWNGRGKYKEPVEPDDAPSRIMPKGWALVSWEAVLSAEEGAFKRGPFGSALTKSIFVDSGFKVYEQYCPINDDCSFARYYVTPEKFKELQTFEVRAGDYLISCSGVTLGRITRVPDEFERGIINQALLRVRINTSIIDHRYFAHLFRSDAFQEAIFDNATGSAIPNVKGVKELKRMAILLPPLPEQTRIVAEIERRLSFVQEIEATVAAGLNRAARLRQAVLQKGFGGDYSNG